MRVQGRGMVSLAFAVALAGCAPVAEDPSEGTARVAGPGERRAVPEPQYTLTDEHIHNKFSSAIPAALRVPSGAVVEVFTHEATGGQLGPDSTLEDVANVDWDRVHALTGPIHVETAEPGDVLAVTFHALEVPGAGAGPATPPTSASSGTRSARAGCGPSESGRGSPRSPSRQASRSPCGPSPG
jgi:hypothetical protein